MSIFDCIYLKDTIDPITTQFITAEATFDIAIMSSEKDYILESGLIALSEDKIFTESPEVTDIKKENVFVKAVKTICNAIRNLISDIADIIGNLFNGNENITTSDYLDSNAGKIKLDTDIRQMDATINDEIRKGNRLLQQVSSATGISDEVIDNWIRVGAEKVNKLLPVIVPAAMGFAMRKVLKSGLKNMRNSVDEAERNATGEEKDEKKKAQKMKILRHMQSLSRDYSSKAKSFAGKFVNKNKKEEE